MDHYSTDNPQRAQRSSWDGNINDRRPVIRRWSAEEIARLMRDHPEYRLLEDPFTCQLIQMVLAEPDDLDTQELLSERIRAHQLAFLGSGDPFWGNYPSPGGLTYPSDFIPLGQMPTGDNVGLVTSQLPLNVGFLGPTGSCKTSLLAVFLSNPLLLQSARVIVFVKKPELRNLASIPQIAHLMCILRRDDLMFSIMEPPPNVPEEAWINEVVRLIGQCYGRFSAQRLLGDIVNKLMANHPQQVYPTLRQIAEVIDSFKPRWGSRQAGYQESISYVLRDLLNCTGSMWDYSASNFLEVLTSGVGLAVIELVDLPQEHATFITSYVMRWLYFKRLHGEPVAL